jgi:NTP pyrophosphatase (non-canonical NTP hydrolase)
MRLSKMYKYLQDSARTAGANKLHTELVPLEFILNTLESIQILAKAIDDAKKGLFYGRDNDDLDFVRKVTPNHNQDRYKDVDVDLLHGILGQITEALELGELLAMHLTGKPIDALREKLLNEEGDLLWYQALVFRKLGVTFEEVGDLNTEKLYKRFPDKFTEDLAIHRDESNENVVFQQT